MKPTLVVTRNKRLTFQISDGKDTIKLTADEGRNLALQILVEMR